MTWKRLIVKRSWPRVNADDPGYDYVSCEMDLPDDSPLRPGSEIMGVEKIGE